MEKVIHVNEIEFEGEDAWTKQFNRCSKHFKKFLDDNSTEQEKKEAWEDYCHEGYMLESGAYNYQ